MRELPAAWCRVPLQDVVPSVDYGISEALGADTRGVPVLRMNNIQDDRFDLGDLRYSSTLVPEKMLLRYGDVLFNRTNSIDHIGKTAMWRDSLPVASFASYLVRLNVDVQRVLPAYLVQWLMCRQVRRQVRSLSTVAVQQVNVNPSRLLELNIDFPVDLMEQQRIIDVLDSVAELQRDIEAEIRKLEIIGASLVRRRIDDLYAESNLVTLADMASVERGKFSARPRNDPAYFGGAYGFIQTGDVSSARRGVIGRASQRLNDAGLAVSRIFPAGTVVVTIAATIGETAILGQPMCFPDSVVGVVANDGVDPRFLELCLHRVKGDLEGKAPQSAQRNINLQDLRPLAVPSVSRGTQADLAGLWDNYQDQIAAMRKESTKLRRLKQGLVEDLLSGRVAVSAVAA